ncbi:hypothetical protein BDZ45DRAFT_743168 [Acephala macrosclerotiorum]|nr:hypothetical protein BDZ45DRAFT_743168 [Acephala macrosclerotiorum]
MGGNRSTLYTILDAKALPAQAFTDLPKTSFILIDIFPGHAQRDLWTSEYTQVEILAEDLKRELESIDRFGYRTLLERYADNPNRSSCGDIRWRSSKLSRDVPNAPDLSIFFSPPKNFRDLVFLATVAENFAALHYFLDRGELILEPCLFSLQLAGYQGENQQVFELVRDPRIANIFLTLLVFSERSEQLLLQHYSLEKHLYSSALLNTIVNEVFTNLFKPERIPEEDLPSRLSVCFFRYDGEIGYRFQSFTNKCSTSYEESIKIMLKYGPTLNENELDKALINALESNNLLAARIFAAHITQPTSQAQNSRTDLILEICRGLDWKQLMMIA